MWVAELGACARAQSDAADHLYHAFGTWSEVVEVAARDRAPAAPGRPDSPTPESSPVGVIARGNWFGLRLLDPLRCLANRVLGACSEGWAVAARPELVQVSI